MDVCSNIPIGKNTFGLICRNLRLKSYSIIYGNIGLIGSDNYLRVDKPYGNDVASSVECAYTSLPNMEPLISVVAAQKPSISMPDGQVKVCFSAKTSGLNADVQKYYTVYDTYAESSSGQRPPLNNGPFIAANPNSVGVTAISVDRSDRPLKFENGGTYVVVYSGSNLPLVDVSELNQVKVTWICLNSIVLSDSYSSEGEYYGDVLTYGNITGRSSTTEGALIIYGALISFGGDIDISGYIVSPEIYV